MTREQFDSNISGQFDKYKQIMLSKTKEHIFNSANEISIVSSLCLWLTNDVGGHVSILYDGSHPNICVDTLLFNLLDFQYEYDTYEDNYEFFIALIDAFIEDCS